MIDGENIPVHFRWHLSCNSFANGPHASIKHVAIMHASVEDPLAAVINCSNLAGFEYRPGTPIDYGEAVLLPLEML